MPRTAQGRPEGHRFRRRDRPLGSTHEGPQAERQLSDLDRSAEFDIATDSFMTMISIPRDGLTDSNSRFLSLAEVRETRKRQVDEATQQAQDIVSKRNETDLDSRMQSKKRRRRVHHDIDNVILRRGSGQQGFSYCRPRR